MNGIWHFAKGCAAIAVMVVVTIVANDVFLQHMSDESEAAVASAGLGAAAALLFVHLAQRSRRKRARSIEKGM